MRTVEPNHFILRIYVKMIGNTSNHRINVVLIQTSTLTMEKSIGIWGLGRIPQLVSHRAVAVASQLV